MVRKLDRGLSLSRPHCFQPEFRYCLCFKTAPMNSCLIDDVDLQYFASKNLNNS